MSNLRPLFTYEPSYAYRLPIPNVMMNQSIRSDLTLPPLPTPHYSAPTPTSNMNRYEPYPPISSSSSHYRKKGNRSILTQPPPPYTTKPLAPYPPIPKPQSNSYHPHAHSHSHSHSNSNSQSGRYQPSRGAQRDAKYTKKEADKAEFLAQAKLQARTSKNHRHSNESTSGPVQSKSYGRHRPPPVPVPLIDHEQHFALENTERIRKEQLIAIQAVRQEHLNAQKKQAEKEEHDKKVRRIQLQVFVHARPTPCGWKGCQARLNSWATLEKHMHHSHLHPSCVSATRMPCEWQGCNGVFWTRDECETHVLVEHMGAFSARCPFDCLFEGPSFPSLMAHISRRHPHATPDDFIPGLIHQKPILPPFSALPQLPSLTEPYKYHPFNSIQPFSGGVGNRYKKLVQRKCFKGRYPRVEAFKDKKGAGAAIRAIIENSKRLREVPPDSAISIMVEGEGEVGDEPGTAKTAVELVDVLGSAKFASEQAKREYGDGDGVDYSTTCSTSSRSSPTVGSIPVSDSGSVSGTSSQKV